MDNESIKRLMAYKPQMRKDRERAARKGKWDKAIRFAMPELAGDDVPDNFSSDGQLYTRQVSEALQGWAYGSNIDWVRITVKGLDEEERKDMEIRKWCQDVETTIKDVFDNSHFYQEGILFTSLCFNLSTAIMYIDYDRDEGEVLFTTLDPRQCLIRFNRAQKLRLFMYEQRLDRIDAMEQFGDELPKEIRDDRNVTRKWRFTHVVAHVSTYDITGIKGDGKWAEFYICDDLKDSGPIAARRVNRCPIVIWRFRRNLTSESWWGCASPGEIAVTELATVNLMNKSSNVLTQRVAEPPITATVGLRNINIRPGGITYLNRGEDYQFKQFNPSGQTMIINGLTMKEERIKEIYYVNFFLIFQQALLAGQRTATESALIDDEKTQNMSSFSSNIVVEFLEPTINAVYDILHEQGLLPQPPESIQDREIKVDFVSQLAVSQRRASTLNPLNRILAIVYQFAQADPTVLRKLNWGAIVDEMARIENVDTDMLTSTEDFIKQQIADAEVSAKQRDIENEIAILDAQGKAYKNMSAAPEAGSPMAPQQNQ